MRKKINASYKLPGKEPGSYLHTKKLKDESDEFVLPRIFDILDRSNTGRLVRSDIHKLVHNRSDAVQEIISRPFLSNLVPLLSSGTTEEYFYRVSRHKRFITLQDLEYAIEYGVMDLTANANDNSEQMADTFNIEFDENQSADDSSKDDSQDDDAHEPVVLYDDVILDNDEDFSFNGVKQWLQQHGIDDAEMGSVGIDEDENIRK